MSRSLFHGSFWAFDVRVGKAGALHRGVVGQQMQEKSTAPPLQKRLGMI